MFSVLQKTSRLWRLQPYIGVSNNNNNWKYKHNQNQQCFLLGTTSRNSSISFDDMVMTLSFRDLITLSFLIAANKRFLRVRHVPDNVSAADGWSSDFGWPKIASVRRNLKYANIFFSVNLFTKMSFTRPFKYYEFWI